MTDNFVKNPGSIIKLFEKIKNQSLSPVELTKGYIDRINQTQSHIEQWKSYDFENALQLAEIREKQALKNNILGPLHGIPVGVKDIIHAEGFKTEYNSKVFQNAKVSNLDSEIVLALKSAGAIILGKTNTTEFAFYDPSPARNPYNKNHTPGGSSSGSGSSVSSGTVPLSIGTQTMASVNRPAIYCGIAAFKPTNGSLSTYGISPLSPTFDTPGFYGWSIKDACYAYEAVSRNYNKKALSEQNNIKVIFINDDLIDDMSQSIFKQLNESKLAFKAIDIQTEEKNSPIKFNDILELHWNIMLYETGRNLNFLLEHPNELIGVRLLEIIKEGLQIKTESYISMRSKLMEYTEIFFSSFDKNTIFVFPAVPDSAPKGIESTGQPKYIAPWTSLSGPVVSCSTGLDSNKMPVGILLCGQPKLDFILSDFCKEISNNSKFFDGLS